MSSTHDPTRFVLVQPSHPGNVGAAARAMKVMGFADLVLVAPRWTDVLTREEAVAYASGAADVLARARVVDSLEQALQGVTLACATAMTPRDFGPPTLALRALCEQWAPQAGPGEAVVGFVFGSERYGLANEHVYRCHATLSIPTQPGYGSLNLAQAVQLVSYEWRQALGSFPVQERVPAQPAADTAAVQGLLDHWQAVLQALGFLDPQAPKKLMPRLQQLAHRARLTQQEVHILRGVAGSMQRHLPSGTAPSPEPAEADPRG
jgi:tRNA/rRNA methyltransferase